MAAGNVELAPGVVCPCPTVADGITSVMVASHMTVTDPAHPTVTVAPKGRCAGESRGRAYWHGLPPGERVVLRLATPGAVQSSVTADKDGRIHATVAVPIRIDAAT